MSIIDQQLAEYRNMGSPPFSVNPSQEDSLLNKIAVQGVEANQLRQSAISDADRARWGFADDYGKMKILMENKYDPSQVVRLRNGDWGVRTQYGIKPVDPKGFQLSDLRGDMAESLGKMITTGGGILGAAVAGGSTLGVGSVAGGVAGTAAGESLRQGIGQMMGVRAPMNKANLAANVAFQDENGWHFGGAGEIIAEAGLSFGAAKVGSIIGNKLSQAGTIKQATNVADNVLSTGEIKPKVLDAVVDMVGLPKQTNKRLIREFIDPDGAIKYIPHEGAINEHILRAGNKIITLVESGKSIADDVYAKGLKDAGVDMSVTKVPIVNATKELDRSIESILKSPLSKQASPIVKQMQDLKTWIAANSSDGQLTLDQIKEVTSSLYNIKNQSFASGVAGKFTSKANRPLAAFTAAKNSNPVIAELNKQYGPQVNALKKLQRLMNIRMEEGLAKEGRFTPEMYIQRLGNELKGRNLDAIIAADDVLSKSPEFASLSVKQDLLTALLGQKLGEKLPMTGGRLSLSGISESASKVALSPRRRAQIIKGLINTGVFNPKALDLEVGKVFTKLSGILNLSAAGNTLPKVGGVITSKPVKEGGKILARQGAQSLNQIVYGNKQ